MQSITSMAGVYSGEMLYCYFSEMIWGDLLNHLRPGCQFNIAKTQHSGYQKAMVATLYKRTSKEVKREVRAINAASKEIGKTAKSARAFLVKHGFVTKDNKVGKLYR